MATKFELSALDSRCERVLSAPSPKKPSYAFRGSATSPPSLITSSAFSGGSTTKVQYTGGAMLGIATMHKSNSVPIFNPDSAVDIAHMRR